VQIDGADKRFWDFRPLFRSSKDRYRTYIVMMVGSFGQLSGNGMITYFLPVLLTNAGIVDQNKKLTLNFVNSVTSFAGALFGSWTVDRLGRRRQLLIGTAICATLLFTITGLLSGKTYSEVRSNAGISLIYLFMVVFSFGWTAMCVCLACYPDSRRY
jgi:MFS family permease